MRKFILIPFILIFIILSGCQTLRYTSNGKIEKPHGQLLFSSFFKFSVFGNAKKKNGIAFYLDYSLPSKSNGTTSRSSYITAYKYVNGHIVTVTPLGVPNSNKLMKEIEAINVEPFDLQDEIKKAEDATGLISIVVDGGYYEYTYQLGSVHFNFTEDSPAHYIDLYAPVSNKLRKFKLFLSLLAYNYGRMSMDESFKLEALVDGFSKTLPDNITTNQ